MFVIVYLGADEDVPDRAPALGDWWEEAVASLESMRNVDIFGQPASSPTESWAMFRVEEGRVAGLVTGGAGFAREALEQAMTEMWEEPEE